jgi:hypothetical protein
VRDHPWFEPTLKEIADGKSGSFLHLSVPTQDALKAHQPKVAGLPSTTVLFDYHDVPIYAEELSDRVNRAVGHGTFIAGLIHQHAPDADVLSLRVMRSDNVGYESDVLLALWLLVDRVERAQSDSAHAEEMIDVVSISLGYYHETWRAEKLTRLSAVIKKLTSLGVVVVAAAGNDSSRRTRTGRPPGTATVARQPAPRHRERAWSASSRRTSKARAALRTTRAATAGSRSTRTASAAASRCGAAPRSPRR